MALCVDHDELSADFQNWIANLVWTSNSSPTTCVEIKLETQQCCNGWCCNYVEITFYCQSQGVEIRLKFQPNFNTWGSQRQYAPFQPTFYQFSAYVLPLRNATLSLRNIISQLKMHWSGHTSFAFVWRSFYLKPSFSFAVLLCGARWPPSARMSIRASLWAACRRPWRFGWLLEAIEICTLWLMIWFNMSTRVAF